MKHKHLLLKLHHFFYIGSVGYIFPFLHVYGKQLGISPLVIGTITAIAPIACLLAKPIFGFIMDYFQAWKKVIFLALFIISTICYTLIFFLPALPGPVLLERHFQNLTCETLPLCDWEYHESVIRLCDGTKDTTCHWVCRNTNFSTQLSFHADQKRAIISPKTTCLLNINETSLCQGNITNNYNCNVTCDNFEDYQCLYTSFVFWSFCILICIFEITFYIFICISDAFSLAILGHDNQLKYGRQRLWGSVGYGIAACLSGYMIDMWSQDGTYKVYTPSLLLALLYVCIDLVCCIKMKLPCESKSTTILKDVFTFLKLKSIVVFLCFVACIGVLNGIMRNFLFWYIEDLAFATGHMSKVKLIEGSIVMAQTFVGETLFFFLSDKILKKLEYGYTFTLCFICYALRLGLISLVPTPWWILVIEFFMQGSSTALSLTTIVSYANVIAPPGASTTVQGLVHGVNDGLGLSIGSLICGIVYKIYGGTIALRIFSVFAAFVALIYFTIHTLYIKHQTENIEWRKPEDAQKNCITADT